MDQQGTGTVSLFCQDARRVAVDGEGEFAFALSAIDGRVGSGVDDHVRSNLAYFRTNLVGIRKIERTCDCTR